MTDVIDESARLDELEREVQRYRLSRDTWTMVVLALGVLTAFASIIAVGLAMRDDDDGGGDSGRLRARRGGPVRVRHRPVDVERRQRRRGHRAQQRHDGPQHRRPRRRTWCRPTSRPARPPSST